ncbi:AAA-domain-containing protein [Sanghuangporus baumii]|uniref:Peroxisomal ATPase PEX6 n=1 Tax=Sanghuangporus baumii TaxID=108892 RepID=A0A9Q5HY63_SANBA|nr:AAA-domain-containing protein [Sanghuangporus baumii]
MFIRLSPIRRVPKPLLPGSVVASTNFNCHNSQGNDSTFCYISVVSPIPLSRVAALASGSHSFDEKELTRIDPSLHSNIRLVRTGDRLYSDALVEAVLPDSRSQSYRLHVATTEPVSQGCYVPDKTQLLLAFSSTEAGSCASLEIPEDVSTRVLTSDDEFTISENFFASSVLRNVVSAPPRSLVETALQEKGRLDSTEKAFSVHHLPRCSAQEIPESYQIYVSTEDLGKVGIFNGDWASLLLLPFWLTIYQPPVYHDFFGGDFSLSPETSRFLVKVGDVITLPIYTDNSWGFADCVDNSSMGEVDESLTHSTVVEDPHLCDVVHFLVSNVEHDLSKLGDVDSRLDAISQSTMFGEFGCWIDPSSTKVVQTGIEHVLVPREDYDSLNNLSETLSTSYKDRFVDLCEIISALLGDNVATLGLEVAMLLKGSAGPGMNSVVEGVAAHLGFHFMQINAYDIVGETAAKTEAILKEEFDFAVSCSPCILLIREIDGWLGMTQTEMNKEPVIARVFQERIDSLRAEWQRSGYPVLVIATTTDAERLPASILSCFKHDLEFEVPDESRRLVLLKSLLSTDYVSADTSLKELSTGTAAFTENDIIDLIFRMRLNATERALNSISGEALEKIGAIRDGGLVLNADDFDEAIEMARTSFSHSIGAPLIPSVSWDDVGGLARVKQDILDTVQLPLENPSLFADGLKQRSGILLYGPPGTGKTLVAKAVATSCSLNFLSVKGPELLNMYIGESEANVRRVFQQAREARPCVIFFDELDSIAPKRGNHGDSGGVMDRIVSQLLAELDGMSSPSAGCDVFVIGATNRPDLLDPALLRPGRFDRLLYLGISDTHEAQLSILEALTRKFHLDPQLDLMDIAEKCPFNYTGADFYALCSDAMLKAMTRKAQSVEATLGAVVLRSSNIQVSESATEYINEKRYIPHQHYPLTPQYYLSELASSSETEVIVSAADFEDALRQLIPSVSNAEMDHYRGIQRQFSEGFESQS